MFSLGPCALVLSLLVAACSGTAGIGGIDDDLVVEKNAKAPAATDNFGNTATGDPGAAGGPSCAATAVEAKLLPLSLVFMIDRSGSMGDSPQKKRLKWDPVVAALKSFLADPNAEGVSASLSYFPQGDPDDKSYCSVATYQKPATVLTALPNAAVAASLDKVVPNGEGTPGSPALKGALTTASALADTKKEAVAVVFVTDGDPNKCSSSPAEVAAIAASYKAKVQTYVIGIGTVATLDAIAKAGGTEAAQVVRIEDPAQSRDEFLKTIAKIRGAALPCTLEIPKPPAGETLDYQKVNLSLTSGGKTTELTNGKDCAAGAGWRYDDPAKPTKLELCPSTCSAAKGEGKLSVTFGCSTKVL